MQNTGLLEMFVPLNGEITYTITLTIYDQIGELYSTDGSSDLATAYARHDELVRKGSIPRTKYLKREVKYEKIPRSNIKNFLYDTVGSSQSNVIKRLDVLYSRGLNSTLFTWE